MTLPLPELAYAPNTAVAELRTAEMFVVSTLRLWAAPHRAPDEEHSDWRTGCRAAGIEHRGVPAFDTLLRIVVTATRRPLDIRCARCPHLGEDEAWMLQLVSALQCNRRDEAETILGVWLPPAAARMAMLPAMGFALALAGGGLVIPLRHREAAQVERLAPAAHAQRGLALVQ